MYIKSILVGLFSIGLYFYYTRQGEYLSQILPGYGDSHVYSITENNNNRTNIKTDYEGSHVDVNNNHGTAADNYFRIATDFFEWGWGDAIHMSPLRKGWSFKQSMNFWELWFANRLGINSNSNVADLGMGIGGPMRRISEFTGAKIKGATICKAQVKRANQITKKKYGDSNGRNLLKYVVGDYNSLPTDEFQDNTFDVVYFMESLSHSHNRSLPLSEAFRILKPGGIVGAWQWMLRDSFNYSDEYHMKLKRDMEYGGGLSNLNKPGERFIEFNDAGFPNSSITESFDMTDFINSEMNGDEWNPHWYSLKYGHDIPSMLTSSWLGRRITMGIAWFTEFIGLAEKGTYDTAIMLEYCGYASAIAGEMGIWTPLWYIKAQKPFPKEIENTQNTESN